MPMTDTRRAQLQIHLCVLLWGFTAILGKLITLPALPLVWWRMLLVVTALGIVGLASFWGQQRTRQIGVRRALGATRGQILRYFQTENFLLASLGIFIGMVLAYGLNQLLMGRYELPRLPLVYLPVGAVALWVLGQVAVYWPARRAASLAKWFEIGSPGIFSMRMARS